MKIIFSKDASRKKGDKVFYNSHFQLFMIKVFRFAVIFVPKPFTGLIARAKWIVSKFRAAMIRRQMHDDIEDFDAATHTIEGYTNEDGSISVHEWTNDNLDQGYANEDASWKWRALNKEAFLKRAGFSRTGCSGVRVFVSLDGIQQKKGAGK